MAEEETNPESVEEQRVYVGFHQLGGVRLVASDIRLSPGEAFQLAGQLQAHATIAIQMAYAEQAMQAQAASSLINPNGSGIITPPGVR